MNRGFLSDQGQIGQDDPMMLTVNKPCSRSTKRRPCCGIWATQPPTAPKHPESAVLQELGEICRDIDDLAQRIKEALPFEALEGSLAARAF
jgi:hypothetical protein